MITIKKYNLKTKWYAICPFCEANIEFYIYTTGICHKCEEQTPRFEKIIGNIEYRIKFHKKFSGEIKEFMEKCS